MKEFELSASWLDLGIYVVTSPWIWLGVATLAFSLLMYFAAISRMDVSYVLPVHASSYVVNGLMAWWLLNEQISPQRWLATVLIALGALTVGGGEQVAAQGKETPEGRNLWWFWGGALAGFDSSLSSGVIGLALADALGDLLTAQGIKQVGEIPAATPAQILPWLIGIVTNPYMIAGVAGNGLAFIFFLSLLSYADISLIRPATGLGYIFSVLGTRYWLREQISRRRWLGISCIGMGVSILSW